MLALALVEILSPCNTTLTTVCGCRWWCYVQDFIILNNIQVSICASCLSLSLILLLSKPLSFLSPIKK